MLTGILVACAIWSFAAALEYLSPTPEGEIFWSKISYLGLCAVPPFYYLSAADYSLGSDVVSKRARLALFIFPAATFLVALTNERHFLLWTEYVPGPDGWLIFKHGIWFWLFVVYGYALMLLGIRWLAQSAIRSTGIYRRQAVLLIAASLIPFLGNFLYIFVMSPQTSLDITPLSFAIMVLALGWTMLYHRFLDLAPVPRDFILQSVQDGIVYLDSRNRVVDLNPAALAILAGEEGQRQEDWFGLTASQAFTALPGLVKAVNPPRECNVELELERGSRIFFYDVHIRPLPFRNTGPAGSLVVFHDVSLRKEAEIRILHMNEDLERLVTIRTETLITRAAELEALADFSAAVRQAPTQNEMLPRIVQGAAEALQADAGALLTFENSALIVSEVYHLPLSLRGTSLADMDLEEQRTFFGETVQVLNNSQQQAPSFMRPLLQPAFRSLVQVTFQTSEAFYGGLVLFFNHLRILTVEDRRLAVSIADIALNAISRASIMETLERRVADRTRELSTLYQVASILNSSPDIQAVCSRSLEVIVAALTGEAGVLHLVDEAGGALQVGATFGLSTEFLQHAQALGVWQWVLDHPEPLLIQDMHQDNRLPYDPGGEAKTPGSGWQPSWLPSYLGTAICLGPRKLGLISVFGGGSPFSSVEGVRLLLAVAEQLGVGIESMRLRDQASALAVTEERQRIARDLHDSITQLLYSQILLADAGLKHTRLGRADEAIYDLGRLQEATRQALNEMRLMIYELRPSELRDRGLFMALQHRLEVVEQRAGFRTQLLGDPGLQMADNVEEALFRVAQEALNNAMKYSAATDLTVEIHPSGKMLSLEIRDNGRGFDLAGVREGMGLRGMRERVAALGGVFEVVSSPGQGACIHVHGPWLS